MTTTTPSTIVRFLLAILILGICVQFTLLGRLSDLRQENAQLLGRVAELLVEAEWAKQKAINPKF
jgi:hypothetical protein